MVLRTPNNSKKTRAVLVALCLALCLGTLAACATGPDRVQERFAWTDGWAGRYGLTPEQLRDVQFWVSDDILLRRIATAGRRDVLRGRLYEQNDKAVDEIFVKAGTPGIVVGSGHDWIAVSFEPGSFLYFTARRDGMLLAPTRSGDTDFFRLWAQDWRGGAGIVPVNGVLYEATPASSNAYLEFERESIARTSNTRHVLQGRQVYRR